VEKTNNEKSKSKSLTKNKQDKPAMPSKHIAPSKKKPDAIRRVEKKESEEEEEEDDEDDEEDESSVEEKDEEENEEKKEKKEKAESPIAIPASFTNRDWKTLVITTQGFDGCWDLAALKKIFELSDLIKNLIMQNPCGDETVWASAIALAILELKCMSAKASWEVVANKGKAFMSKKLFALEQKDADETLKRVQQLITKAKELMEKII